jgi:hypothetical protein
LFTYSFAYVGGAHGTSFTRVRTTARKRGFHIAYRASEAMSQAVE